MQCPIDSVKVKERVRREMGDISSLMDSMKKYGQLSPIVVNHEYELVAGHRRLQAARKLGWHTVEIKMVETDSRDQLLEIELEENVHRKDFSPEELLAGYRLLDKLRTPRARDRVKGFFGRIWGWLIALFRGADADEPPQAESADAVPERGEAAPTAPEPIESDGAEDEPATEAPPQDGVVEETKKAEETVDRT